MTNSVNIGAVKTDVFSEHASDGTLKPQKRQFSTPFGSGADDLEPAPNKYHLVWAETCPYAHMPVIARSLLGLDNIISIGRVSDVVTHKGRYFKYDENEIDPVLKIHALPEAYLKADPNYSLRATVPALIDVETGKTVNNDYMKLSIYFARDFKPWHKTGAPDIFPKELRTDILALNDWIFKNVNNAVYRCGFANTQKAYDKAHQDTFSAFDYLEERLSRSRYLFGNQLTVSDIHLYSTLCRFDVAYYTAFNVNKKRLTEYPNLWNYTKDLYQISAFGETTNLDATKAGYYSLIETYKVVPKGPDKSIFREPHDRDRFNPCKFEGKMR